VLSGLDATTRVVAAGAGFLADGDTVRVVAAAPAVWPPATCGPTAAKK
jgi:HlyD family secretion protein